MHDAPVPLRTNYAAEADLLKGVDPLCLLPARLHEEALKFLTWLGAVNDMIPAACPYCSSTTIKAGKRRKWSSRRAEYVCCVCEKWFTASTDTALKGLLYPHLWRVHLSLSLAGWSEPLIATHLRITPGAAGHWTQAFLSEMQRRAPSLHDWWRSRPHQNDSSMPPSLEEQAREFLGWIDEFARTPSLYADTLFDTPLVEQYLPAVARLLLQGCSVDEIERDLDLRRYRFVEWRRGLEDIVHARWPLLRSWLDWQRERRYRAARTGRAAKKAEASTQTCNEDQ